MLVGCHRERQHGLLARATASILQKTSRSVKILRVFLYNATLLILDDIKLTFDSVKCQLKCYENSIIIYFVFLRHMFRPHRAIFQATNFDGTSCTVLVNVSNTRYIYVVIILNLYFENVYSFSIFVLRLIYAPSCVPLP
jgi:hypothetical protein